MKPLAVLYMDSSTYYPADLRERVAAVRIFELEKQNEALSIVIPWSIQEDTLLLPVGIKNYIEKYIESQICTIPVAFTDEEQRQKQLIRYILYGDRDLNPGEEIDIDRIFEALAYHAAFFVTVDKKHIFSKAHQFLQHFKLQVMSPSQCLPIVEQYLKKKQANYADLYKKNP